MKQRSKRSTGKRPHSPAIPHSATVSLNRTQPWIGPLLIGVAAVAMFGWSWGTWPDVLVDFGRELYVPWRLSEGDVLYRDIAYFNGPLSPYFNALWFALFGASLRVLALVNFMILVAMLALIYSLVTQIASRRSATLSCLVITLVFAFSRYLDNGNYNFICPYSHEMTHGLALSLGALWFVGRFARSGRIRDAAAAGACVGLVFLTKPEIFLACAPATTLGILLGLATQPAGQRRVTTTLAAFFIACCLPPLAAVAAFSIVLPYAEAARVTSGGLRWIFSTEITSLPFYRQGMGVNKPEHAQWIIRFAASYIVLFGTPAAIGMWFTPRQPRARVLSAVVAFFVAGFALFILREQIPMGESLRPLPFVLLGALIAMAVAWRRVPSSDMRARWNLSLAFVTFAALLLAKILFFARTTHYGFVLAVPGTVVLIVLLWDWIPEWIDGHKGCGAILRGAFLATVAMFVALHLEAAVETIDKLTVRVGSGGDAFWADERGVEVNRILAELQKFMPADATLVGVPEGAWFNYLTRHINSTPYITFMPVELLMFGEQPIVAAFERAPPDFVVRSDETMTIYGYEAFGFGYAERLSQWILAHYEPIGEPPRNDGKLFHALVYRRKP